MFWLSFIPKGLIPLTLVLTFYLSNRFVYDQFCACCLHHFSGILLCCLFIVLCFSFRVYSQMSQVTNNLTHPRFQVTDEEEEADIMWNYNHIKDYRSAVKQHTHTHTQQQTYKNVAQRSSFISLFHINIVWSCCLTVGPPISYSSPINCLFSILNAFNLILPVNSMSEWCFWCLFRMQTAEGAVQLACLHIQHMHM